MASPFVLKAIVSIMTTGLVICIALTVANDISCFISDVII